MGQTCGCTSRFEASREIAGQGTEVLRLKPYLGLNSKDIDRIYHFFLFADLYEDNHLHIQELIACARLENFKGVEFLETIFLLYDGHSDATANGRMNFFEFILALFSFLSASSDDLIRLCFALIDLDNSKVITVDEMKFMLTIIWGDKPHKKVGYNKARNVRPIVTLDSRVANALKIFDVDKSGDVTLDEFIAFNAQVPIVMLPLISLQYELRKQILGNWRWKDLEKRRHMILNKKHTNNNTWHPYRLEMIRLLTPPNPYGYGLSFMTALLRRSSSKSIIPTTIDKRVQVNLSSKKRFNPRDLEIIANDDGTEVSDIDIDLSKERHGHVFYSAAAMRNSTSKALHRGQIQEARPEKSDSAKQIQKIVRGKQGRNKARVIQQKKVALNHHERGGGGGEKVTKKNDTRANKNNNDTTENNTNVRYVGIHRKKDSQNNSATTIQKFLKQASFRRRRRRLEAAGTLTLGEHIS